MRNIFRPAPHSQRLEEDEVNSTYRRLRWQVFMGIFIGYAGYYLVRKNFSLAMPYLVEEGYTKQQLGFALSGVSIAYGLSKFLMGNVSDRSNPRYFMALGLVGSSMIMFCMGYCQWATSSVAVMFTLMLINGWVQGMGWPACGRTLVHWYSKHERGSKVAWWNIAHNVGGGLIGPLAALGVFLFSDWKSLFYLPAMFALTVAFLIILLLRDTPQSEGLPAIEDYKNDKDLGYADSDEAEMSAKQIFMEHVLRNKYLWFIALANVFVYLIRNGVLDWAPTYLKEVKDFNIEELGWSYFAYEYAGIPGTLLCGWLSDRVFNGRRAPAGIVYLLGVIVALMIYWFNPPNNPMVDIAALILIGFFIYGPVMLIGLHALDCVPKKAAGTAAGLTGLFGYLGGAVAANILMGWVIDIHGWDGAFQLMVGSCVLAIGFLSLTLRQTFNTPEKKI